MIWRIICFTTSRAKKRGPFQNAFLNIGGAKMEYLPYIIGAAAVVVSAVVFFFFGSAHRRKTAEAAIGSAEEQA